MRRAAVSMIVAGAALWWAHGFGGWSPYARTFNGNTGRWDYGLFAYPAPESVVKPWYREGPVVLCQRGRVEDVPEASRQFYTPGEVYGPAYAGMRCSTLP